MRLLKELYFVLFAKHYLWKQVDLLFSLDPYTNVLHVHLPLKHVEYYVCLLRLLILYRPLTNSLSEKWFRVI